MDDYETLNYRPILDRRKRSSDSGDGATDLKFRSHGRTFHLRLFPVSEDSVFSEDHRFDVNGEHNELSYDNFLYEGYVKGSFDFQIRT